MRYNHAMVESKTSVLLHCCCAPCTLVPLEHLVRAGWQLSLYFYNPNIHPLEEYERRLTVLQDYADANGLALYVGDYDTELWEEKVGMLGGPYPLRKGAHDYQLNEQARKKRCRACYELRFEFLAAQAARTGCNYIDATLTISPYQFTQEALSAINRCAAEQGREALASDWREYYLLSVQRSRALGMYRQKYCGCRFSKAEAKLERN